MSPGWIRLYPGFRYDDDKSNDPNVGALHAINDFRRAATVLGSLRSEAVDSGAVWDAWGGYVTPESRVDWRLLEALRTLDEWLCNNGVKDRALSHAMIGKCVYLRYLRQRKILSDTKLNKEWSLSYDEAFGHRARLSTFIELVERLDEWLNGSVFPLSPDKIREFGAERLRKVASVFHGGTVEGQLPLFDMYDFSLIPIETLSVIYEQFLHATHHPSAKSQGAARGAYYTPVPLVNFIVDRLDSRKPLGPGMRVLDPACGSGAFLVQCYRKLIERRLSESPQDRLRPAELGRLLTNHIFGIDIDEDACQIAELSLSLTLLEYVDPPDLTKTQFKLPVLRGRNIFCTNAFNENEDWERDAQRSPFDWIVGNPPWKELNPKRLDDADKPSWAWMQRNRTEHPIGGNQLAEAFAWRASGLIAADGVIGLLLPAMTLFKYESTDFRKVFLKKQRVWYVANFANLAEVLFAGRARLPAAAFFYSPKPKDLKNGQSASETIEVFSPFLANQPSALAGKRGKRPAVWNLIVNASDLRELSYADVLDGSPQPWKLAMWGSSIDKRVLTRVDRCFRTFGQLEDENLLLASQGLELRVKDEANGEPTEPHPELAGMLMLSVEPLKKRRHLIRFPAVALQPLDISRTFVSSRAGFSRRFSVCQPPHVLVGASRNFAIYTDDPVIVPSRQIGVTSPKGNKPLLKALALYLNSDFVAYHQFLNTTQAGIQKTISTLKALRTLPLPFADDSALKDWESLYSRIAKATAGRDDFAQEDLVRELNELTFAALGLNSQGRAAVQDLVHLRFALVQGKIGKDAVRPPFVEELKSYARTLRDDLDAFVGEKTPLRHRVEVLYGGGSGVVAIEIVRKAQGRLPVRVLESTDEAAQSFAVARRELIEKRTQWLYFSRNLRVYETSRTYILKPLQRLQWTQTQAMQDAGDIIAESIQPHPVESKRVVG
ncbi:MAG TPA: N-6 DNA methylase [Edaphobacter sp.]|uniref:HsdM family class I SAM-dependent methyltransferase n=1 Tax=Edaphobacter sp. TaxID=1934404 RepID=UPI002B7AE744|nr:N-6 DNA methylase [Edaphobacter sp.]HUZ97158.1 N-6 DNA methylase [Edaphobacter sp.]